MHVVGTEAVSSPSEKQVAYDWKKRVTDALLEIPKGEKLSLRELAGRAEVPRFDDQGIRTLTVHMSALALRGSLSAGSRRKESLTSTATRTPTSSRRTRRGSDARQ